MSDGDEKLNEIRERHRKDARWHCGPSMICPQSHDDRRWLLNEIEHLRAENSKLKSTDIAVAMTEMSLRDEIERLRAERDALKAAAREFLTTLGAAMKTGKFHMGGSADMCHFVRQAMQKLDVLAFDREEKRSVGLERLHEEFKP